MTKVNFLNQAASIDKKLNISQLSCDAYKKTRKLR